MELVEFKNHNNEINMLLSFLALEDHDFYPPLHDRGSIKEYLQEMTKGNILYFTEDNKIIALVNYFEYYPKYETAYIKFIAVLPEFRHHHLGKQLMVESLQKLEDAKINKITMTTWSTDKPAIHLYQELGFQIEKVIKDDRAKNVDTIILQKQSSILQK